MKQTAVDFLEDCFDKYEKWISGHYKAEAYSFTDLSNDIQKAKEMHNQEIIDAWNNGLSNWDNTDDCNAKQYYIETFKN
jgi:hypothetical protein